MAKHHTLPVFFLRGFVDPASCRGRNPYLWVADVEEKRVYRRGPENVAAISRFYDWEDLNNVASLESFHSIIETRAARVFRKLRDGKFVLSRKERYHLCLFVGFQISRTKRFHERLGVRAVNAAKASIREWAKNPKRLKEDIEAYAQARSEPTLEIDAVRQFIDEERYTIEPGKDRLHGLAIDLALKFVPVVGATRWTIFLAPDDLGFVTTDQGVALLTSDAKSIDIDFKTFHNPGLEIYVPISRDYALLMHQTTTPEGIVSLDKSSIREIQRRVLPTVDRYVFASAKRDAEWALDSRS